jgi:serine/threonine protein kinase
MTVANPRKADAAAADAGPGATEGSAPAADGTGSSTPGSFSKPEAERSGLTTFQTLGSYEVLERLGGGGMADVHVARATLAEGVDRLVALKTVLPEFGADGRVASMFLNEARISANLQHPNIAQVYDFGEVAGRAYLAMEYVHGRDLLALIRRMSDAKRLIPPGFAIAVIGRVAEALDYVHGRRDLDGRPLNLVHRDVSPSNVLVTPRGEVKLVDFGVVAAEGSRSDGGVLVGKSRYLTVEQATGQIPEPSWDLFSLGVVLYELLTLRRPYKVPSVKALVKGDIRDDRRPPSEFNLEIPRALSDFVLRATERAAERRFASARDFHTGLMRAAGGIPEVDVGWVVRTVFGRDLAEEETKVEKLMVALRERDRRRASGFAGRLRQLSRRIRSSSLVRQHPRAVRGAAAGIALAVLAGGGVGWYHARSAAELTATLTSADQRLLAGQVVGPGGDQALDLLLGAQRRWPDHPAVAERLQAIADTFQALGEKAIHRGNAAEAALHFQVALQADGSRAAVATRLAEAEALVLQGAGARTSRHR